MKLLLMNVSNPCESNKRFYRENDSLGYICLEDNDETTNCHFLTEINECVENCPIGMHFIKDNNKCVSSCEGSFKKIDNDGEDYIIYECLDNSCDDLGMKEIYNTKECVNSCENLYEYNGFCYSDCQTEADVEMIIAENYIIMVRIKFVNKNAYLIKQKL